MKGKKKTQPARPRLVEMARGDQVEHVAVHDVQHFIAAGFRQIKPSLTVSVGTFAASDNVGVTSFKINES